jgi:hypothetical protein
MTNTKPTKPGFYWHESESQSRTIVEIVDGFGVLEVMYLGNECLYPLHNTDGKWAPVAPLPPERKPLTCDTCPAAETCPYAGDDYNTDGDCLADK